MNTPTFSSSRAAVDSHFRPDDGPVTDEYIWVTARQSIPDDENARDAPVKERAATQQATISAPPSFAVPKFHIIMKKNINLKDLLTSIVPPSTGLKAPCNPSPLIPGTGTGAGRTPEIDDAPKPQPNAPRPPSAPAPIRRGVASLADPKPRPNLPLPPSAPPRARPVDGDGEWADWGVQGSGIKVLRASAEAVREGGERAREVLAEPEPDTLLPDDGACRNRAGWIRLL